MTRREKSVPHAGWENQNPLPIEQGRYVGLDKESKSLHLLSARLVETNQGGRPGSPAIHWTTVARQHRTSLARKCYRYRH